MDELVTSEDVVDVDVVVVFVVEGADIVTHMATVHTLLDIATTPVPTT